MASGYDAVRGFSLDYIGNDQETCSPPILVTLKFSPIPIDRNARLEEFAEEAQNVPLLYMTRPIEFNGDS